MSLLAALDRVDNILRNNGDLDVVSIDAFFDVEGVTVLESTITLGQVPLGERWELLAFNCMATQFALIPEHQMFENGRIRWAWQCDGTGLLAGSVDAPTDVIFNSGSVLTVRSAVLAGVGRATGPMHFQFLRHHGNHG